MITVNYSTEINCSPEKIFDYLADATNETEWNPEIKTVKKLNEGPIGEGTASGAIIK
jgi:Polyketide cyclase / dehydrase and lipid transport